MLWFMMNNVARLDNIFYKLIMTAKLIDHVFPPNERAFNHYYYAQYIVVHGKAHISIFGK